MRKISREGRQAMGRAGKANLERYLAGQRSEATQRAHAKVEAFEKALREEFPNPPAIVGVLIDSAVASYLSLLLVTSKHSLAMRIDRLERVHALQVEVQRVLFRTVRALTAYAESPEARRRALERLDTAIGKPEPTPTPLTPDEQALADRKARKEAAWRSFMNTGFQGEPPSERLEDY